MFFTGVRDRRESASPTGWLPRWQVIGAAWSTDPLLLTWTQLPQPVWAPCPEFGLPGVDWALCSPTQAWRAADFRDPFVLAPEPGSGDPWLMYFTARPRIDQFNYVAGVAQAPGPRGPWTDLGALWDTYYPPLNSKVESPHAFRQRPRLAPPVHRGQRDDRHRLAHVARGARRSGRGRRGRRSTCSSRTTKDHPYEFELEPEAWFASEHFTLSRRRARPAEFLAVVHSYDAPAIYNPPPPAHSRWTSRSSSSAACSLGRAPASASPCSERRTPCARSPSTDDDGPGGGSGPAHVLGCDGGGGRTAELGVMIRGSSARRDDGGRRRPTSACPRRWRSTISDVRDPVDGLERGDRVRFRCASR